MSTKTITICDCCKKTIDGVRYRKVLVIASDKTGEFEEWNLRNDFCFECASDLKNTLEKLAAEKGAE